MAEYAETGGGNETPKEAFGREQQDIALKGCGLAALGPVSAAMAILEATKQASDDHR